MYAAEPSAQRVGLSGSGRELSVFVGGGVFVFSPVGLAGDGRAVHLAGVDGVGGNGRTTGGPVVGVEHGGQCVGDGVD